LIGKSGRFATNASVASSIASSDSRAMTSLERLSLARGPASSRTCRQDGDGGAEALVDLRLVGCGPLGGAIKPGAARARLVPHVAAARTSGSRNAAATATSRTTPTVRRDASARLARFTGRQRTVNEAAVYRSDPPGSRFAFEHAFSRGRARRAALLALRDTSNRGFRVHRAPARR
jgi:hypothetical protein